LYTKDNPRKVIIHKKNKKSGWSTAAKVGAGVGAGAAVVGGLYGAGQYVKQSGKTAGANYTSGTGGRQAYNTAAYAVNRANKFTPD
jgi:hypothetical protein